MFSCSLRTPLFFYYDRTLDPAQVVEDMLREAWNYNELGRILTCWQKWVGPCTLSSLWLCRSLLCLIQTKWGEKPVVNQHLLINNGLNKLKSASTNKTVNSNHASSCTLKVTCIANLNDKHANNTFTGAKLKYETIWILCTDLHLYSKS
jgi:hypothetical protein